MHVNELGLPGIVDASEKAVITRMAVAKGLVCFSKEFLAVAGQGFPDKERSRDTDRRDCGCNGFKNTWTDFAVPTAGSDRL